jgi:uncharacterized repeat protein (TIGR03803 family)
MKLFRELKNGATVFALSIAAAVAAPAQSFTTLDTGIMSVSPLVQGIDGNLYGSNSAGAPSGKGSIFRITPAGALSTFYTFHGPDGGGPSGLAVETNGNLYGVTTYGGATEPGCPTPIQGCGTVFELSATGVHTTLHSFNGTDGISPIGGLTLGPDGATFFGVTRGTSFKTSNGFLYGTIYKITGTGTFTLLHTFSLTDGGYPLGPLVLGTNGNLYGTTSEGGMYGSGTIFEITSSGTFTTIHNFNGHTDGGAPAGALVQAANGDFYGATSVGPTSDTVNDNGTIFSVTQGGATFNVVYAFTEQSLESDPTGIVLGSDGNFYGATSGNSQNVTVGDATLFQVTPAGVLTTLHDFGSASTANPNLMQATNGTFYGTIGQKENGTPGPGSIFSLTTGLGPFVEAVPAYRGIGSKVLLLGQGFTGATSVTFNGVSATFTVNSDTEITTTVPTGATKGYIEVTTPSGMVSTKVFFTVS